MKPVLFLSLTVLATATLLALPAKAVPLQSSQVPMGAEEPQISYGARVASNDYYDVYYDGGRGVFSDGYWGTDGRFYYQTGPESSTFAPDTEGHFRRTPARGFGLVRGTGVQRQY